MPGRSVEFSIHLVRGKGFRFDQIKRRIESPWPREVHQALADVMRKGPGSVAEQQDRTTEMSYSGNHGWLPTQPFGSRPAPRRTLHVTGKLDAAWRGGTGAITEPLRRGIRIGVDRSRFPQAHVFQRTRPTLIEITPRMRGYVRHHFGVNFRRDKTHVVIQPRPVSVNPVMVRRMSERLLNYLMTGSVLARGRRGARAA